MKRAKIFNLMIIAAVVISAACVFVSPGIVVADQVTFYPTVDSYISEDNPNTNYGVSCLGVRDFYDVDDEHRQRTLIKVDNQSAGGNVTQVLLQMYYFDYFDDNPNGLALRAYRLTDSFEEYEVSWLESEDGDSWTYPGGDYTTANYTSATVPSSFGWITWNITAMANVAWGASSDLYVVIRFRYEDGDWTHSHWVWLDCAEGTYRPKVLVTYSEEVQTPTVGHVLDEYGHNYCNLVVTPTLYDYPWAMLYAQGAVNGTTNYTIESSGINVTSNDPVIRSLTGLNASTLYGVRAKMVYSNGTVYSNATNVTTMSYIVPTWTKRYDDLTVRGVQVYTGWTNNTNSKTVYAKVGYRTYDTPTWSYTSQYSSADAGIEYNWVVSGLLGETLHYYKGVYTIDGYEYESDVGNFTTLDWPTVVVTANQTDLDFMKLNVNYECGGADHLDISARIRPADNPEAWTYSDERNGKTGTGVEYFTFNDLYPQTQYVVHGIGAYDGYTADDAAFVWTVSISDYPVLSNLSALFIAPYTLRLSMNVELNDAEDMDIAVRFWLECYPFVEGDEFFCTQDLGISTDGWKYIDVICGEFVDWDWQYTYYGEIDWVSGTNQTTTKVLTVPPMPFYVLTLQPQLLGGTSVQLNGYAQQGECYTEEPPDVQGGPACFVYWKTGDLSTLQQTVPVDVYGITGSWSTIISGLVYGRNYSYKAEVMGSCGADPYGEVVTFVIGQQAPPTIPSIGSTGTFLFGSAPGHWLLILLAMGITALIFFQKHRTVAIVLCLMVLGFGIVIGWIDVWIIVLLGIGVGFVIWRQVRKTSSGN